MNSAQQCRRNGWLAGTILEGDEGYGPERILITAVGEESILARRLTDGKGNPVTDSERNWTLEFRKWRRITSRSGSEAR